MNVVLLELIPRRVVVLPAREFADPGRQLFPIAVQPDVVNRPERVHDARDVHREQLGLDKLRDDLSCAHAVAEADVVVVEENREQPDVVARRLCLLVDHVADLARRLGNGVVILGDVDQLEGLDRLRLAVLGHLEVFLLQVVDRVPLPIGDDDVDPNEVDVGAEDRGLGRGSGGGGCCGDGCCCGGGCWAGAFCALSPSAIGAAITAANATRSSPLCITFE